MSVSSGSFLTSIRTLENKVMKALRDPRAAEIVDQPAQAFSITTLAGHRHILLVTARRDGRRIATPMWFAIDGERLVVRSGATDPKLARIRRHADVNVAPCNARGRPLGPPMAARARVLDAHEEPSAEQALQRALGWQRSIYSFLRGPLLPMAYIEITAR